MVQQCSAKILVLSFLLQQYIGGTNLAHLVKQWLFNGVSGAETEINTYFQVTKSPNVSHLPLPVPFSLVPTFQVVPLTLICSTNLTTLEMYLQYVVIRQLSLIIGGIPKYINFLWYPNITTVTLLS
jgi:hypothetical protein